MFDHPLPKTAFEALDWSVEHYQPYLDQLVQYTLTSDNLTPWLEQWSQVNKFIYEVYQRIYVATTVDTTDEIALKRFETFMSAVFPVVQVALDQLNRKLLTVADHLPEGFDVPLRYVRTQVQLFREENLPLFTEQSKLDTEYDQIIGAQTIEWEGQELTLPQLDPILQETDRAKREQVWRLSMERRLQDRETLNQLWVNYMKLRGQIAKNAGFSDYLSYRWQDLGRFDYTPADSVAFQNAIEQVVVPVAQRLYQRRQAQLGVESLRPWDTLVDTLGRAPLRPYQSDQELESRMERIFDCVDPIFGRYFQTMRDEKLLDLPNRKGKAPGGYCTTFSMVERPYIFMNAVGMHDDVQTLLHEGGHAFHAFESFKLPYNQQQNPPMEFAEVASMAMELLGAPYLTQDQGGYYSESESARARIEHLEGLITFWGYMAVVDAFQHWVYTHHEQASIPANCDQKWSELWDRFMIGIDYNGLEAIKETGWQRKVHIYQLPFYYVEYGLAQLGAVQVWANSLRDQAKATADYRYALSLGGTKTLPELFSAAGAKFAFDPETLQTAVELIETTITQLERA
ncbi:MAG: M3 family oligoendopeptidase [Anaerolineae bacterium]|jgi:oligoendopeptidase F|nr:M3 family oligoendopeptidase [Anaerolineae bacterium]